MLGSETYKCAWWYKQDSASGNGGRDEGLGAAPGNLESRFPSCPLVVVSTVPLGPPYDKIENFHFEGPGADVGGLGATLTAHRLDSGLMSPPTQTRRFQDTGGPER